MWRRLESTDIDKARQSLGHRLAETMRRQEEELSSIRAKHTEEIRVLETKQGEIDSLDALIDRFAEDFNNSLSEPEPVLDQHPADAGVSSGRIADEQEPDKKPTGEAIEAAPTALTLPERIAVRYGSPHFDPFRQLGFCPPRLW